ncbi:MAG: thermonuclease family protein [Gammaproteobacteria bacterium]
MQRELLNMLRKTLGSELSKRKRRKSSSVIVVIVLSVAIFFIDQWLREPAMPTPNPGTDLSCEVRDVYDGDTVTAGCEAGKLKIRVWGIDAPEKKQKPWGDQSQEYLEKLVDGKTVQVQVTDTDRYGRSVARLFVAGQDAGLQMVREGYAIVYEQYNDSQGYRDAQAEAQRAKLGVWSQPGDQQDPAAWRRLNSR